MLRSCRYFVLLLTFLVTSIPCFAAEPQVFDLTWQASGSGCSFSVQPDVQEPFAKEPDFEGREVMRGLLPCAQDADQRLAYIWDIEQKRLYIDRNHNRNLTDDPNGIYESSRQDLRYQDFRDVEIEVPRGTQVYAYRFSMNFSRYNPPRVYCHVSVRSGFQAQIDLAEQAYRVQLADNLDGQLDQSDKLHISLVRPDQPGLSSAHLSVPSALFLGGHLYDCRYAFIADANQPQVQLTLTERETPLGQLTIAGQDVDYLELHSQWIVPIFEPNQPAISIPVGNYTCQALNLRPQGQNHVYVQGLDKRVTIKQGELSTLKLGAPLKSTVSVNRANKCLVLNFKMVGQGGEEYSSSGTRETTPRFKVFQGDKEVHSGEFEYG